MCEVDKMRLSFALLKEFSNSIINKNVVVTHYPSTFVEKHFIYFTLLWGTEITYVVPCLSDYIK